MKIFQVQLSAAQHKNAKENDSFFVLHVDLSGWAPGKIHTVERERKGFQVNCVTKRKPKPKSDEISKTLKHGKSAARFVQDMAKWQPNGYAKINLETKIVYAAQQISSIL